TESTFEEQNIEVLAKTMVKVPDSPSSDSRGSIPRSSSRPTRQEGSAREEACGIARRHNAEEIESIVKQLNKASKLRPFHYSHQGSLAYISSDKAIADLPFMNRRE
ncbi:NADH:ubiquinone oxidoreductase, partial [Tulasnella sp. 425]